MKFQDFLKDDDATVRRVSKVLAELTEAFELKSISREEYDELTADILDVGKIDDLATSVEQKAKLEEAFDALASIVGTVV